MRRALAIALLAGALVGAGVLAQSRDDVTTTAPSGVRFGHVDVFLDSKDQPLAAWQCEITATAGDVTLVGIEGGEHPAFKTPPYYDPRALGQKRIILGAFNTGSDLPTGKMRVARLMVQISGATKPAYEAKVQVAASPDGKAIPATISVTPFDSEGAER
jgi:hypothetical protein